MGRRKANFGEDLIGIGAHQPWWLNLVLAIGAYFLFHNLAAIETGAGTSTDIGQVLPRQVLKTGSMLAQYGVPAFLLIGAISAFFKRKKRAHLFESVANGNSIDTLDSLTWQQFEDLIHEYFRRQGYEVKETSKGPDGGIDLKLCKDGKPATVQCKHWRNKKVGVNVIREQFGIMAAESVSEGFVVTSGQLTEDAYAVARGKPLKLIDGDGLRQHLNAIAHDGEINRDRNPVLSPSCPACGSEMRLRTAARGTHSGREFWGCGRYPKCRGTQQIA